MSVGLARLCKVSLAVRPPNFSTSSRLRYWLKGMRRNTTTVFVFFFRILVESTSSFIEGFATSIATTQDLPVVDFLILPVFVCLFKRIEIEYYRREMEILQDFFFAMSFENRRRCTNWCRSHKSGELDTHLTFSPILAIL